MKIHEIGWQPCKIGKTTISVYHHDTGKLAGLVKDIERCGVDMPMRKRFDLRQKYHWNLTTESNCILVDGNAYYIVNDRTMFFYEDMQRNRPEAYAGMFEEEHARKLADIDAAKQCGVEILRLNLK